MKDAARRAMILNVTPAIVCQVACGSGLELIYEFLLTDELANRPDLLRSAKAKVGHGNGGQVMYPTLSGDFDKL